MVEQPAVNRLVAGSNPARGATGPFNTLERDFRMSHHFVPSGAKRYEDGIALIVVGDP